MNVFLTGATSLCATSLWARDQVTLLLGWFVDPDTRPEVIAQAKEYLSDAGWIPEADPVAKVAIDGTVL